MKETEDGNNIDVGKLFEKTKLLKSRRLQFELNICVNNIFIFVFIVP